MQVLVLNSGSSSLKFQLFSMPEETIICSGVVERIGFNDALFNYNNNKKSIEIEAQILNHRAALKLVSQHLLSKDVGVIKSPEEITIVGHRVVHGGSSFSDTTEITKVVKEKIKKLIPLAPLHNPANLEGIDVAEDIFPQAKQVAVFDTAFHQTIPEHAYKYAIPNEFLTENRIRLYGFHGTSHKYVSEKAIDYLDKKESKIITIHLGNGCSMTAVKNGESIDHSLGFSPLSGLIMGTRSGDIDPSIIFHLKDKLDYNLKDINTLLNKKSGMLGLTGYSDLRDIEIMAAKGNKDCQLALNMNAYRIKKYIGSYAAVLNGLDAIVFTAGIGENSQTIRQLVCKHMDFFGIHLDETKNNIRSKTIREINTKESKVKILVIPTNEELEIAKQAVDLFKN
ncbi:acetate/propionate family kinase [Aestuariibaculum sediminum]|uniref:Acetate kinase n=1 Tax=Aestuariibaculum sediminum TaxID=2770637 RepID=A0A8J6Q9Y3_9FLAO|nr:acetate kinase [Aestuariibaculum sediminum]MBD0832887.1 acetate kinase [Aestuariibaculum sediminum]